MFAPPQKFRHPVDRSLQQVKLKHVSSFDAGSDALRGASYDRRSSPEDDTGQPCGVERGDVDAGRRPVHDELRHHQPCGGPVEDAPAPVPRRHVRPVHARDLADERVPVGRKWEVAGLSLGYGRLAQLRGDFADGVDQAGGHIAPHLLLPRPLRHRDRRVREPRHVHLAFRPRVHFRVPEPLEEDGLRQRPIVLHQDAVVLLAVHRRESEALGRLCGPRPHGKHEFAGCELLAVHCYADHLLFSIFFFDVDALHGANPKGAPLFLSSSDKSLC
mmetsp:Transcript_16805/g.33651  ORF Transcript_16805/g.33651 Transcript_16805/m.33651 type:complete len:273 (+) Transcript_16805:81-899(+)